MKILSQKEVLAILNNEKESSISNEHSDAVQHEQRLRLHSETRLKLIKGQHRALDQFISDLPQKLLPEEKFKIFLTLITSPLPTVEIVDAAYNDLFKVFFGQNKVIDFKFNVDPETIEKDWAQYRRLKGFNDWFKLEGWDVFKNHINAAIVVDLPPLITGENGEVSMSSDQPEPFFFYVPTENVIDQYNDHNNICHYFLYENDVSRDSHHNNNIDKIAYYIDSERYSTYVRIDSTWKFLSESPHDLRYTPVQSFWNKPLRDSTYQRQNPVTPNLGALDWMLYSIISKRNLDLYAGFPIISVYEQQCNYKNSDGFDCESGNINVYTDATKGPVASQPCPKCSQNQMIGAGSTIFLPLPDPEIESNVNLMPGVQVTHGDVKSLDQMNKELDRQKREFMIHVTGFDRLDNNSTAPSKNNLQLNSDVESRHNIIMEVKEGFENIEKFVLDTAARLRYGDAYVGSVINYGSRFFLKTFQEMQNDYKLAKDNGIPSFELQNMRREIYEKKYASDPKILERIRLLSQLEPYPDYTVAQLQGLVAFIDPEELAFKIAFNDLTARFEREFGPLDQYFTGLNLDMRVELIKAKLLGYLNEMDITFETKTDINTDHNGKSTSTSTKTVREE